MRKLVLTAAVAALVVAAIGLAAADPITYTAKVFGKHLLRLREASLP